MSDELRSATGYESTAIWESTRAGPEARGRKAGTASTSSEPQYDETSLELSNCESTGFTPAQEMPKSRSFYVARNFILEQPVVSIGIPKDEWTAQEELRPVEARRVGNARTAEENRKAADQRRAEENRSEVLVVLVRWFVLIINSVLKELVRHGALGATLHAKEREFAPRCNEDTQTVTRSLYQLMKSIKRIKHFPTDWVGVWRIPGERYDAESLGGHEILQ
ncbi:hypothetical protein NP233_g12532 [Leucocoprinus birnbaumii]|uniref:Uncharacterized protein n=1 Tax=Leucocoprinus birnbaumii TaxID=56174 RepID=A0AAD5VEG3_9AGAR|nr:hypothetical protein NP233_g12532 [Leucocoprinus birnbaumii]